jgi:preprotein translocase subunit SecA
VNNKIEIWKMQSIVKKINGMRDTYRQMTNEDLRSKASELKERRKTESGDLLLVESFALVREASRRALNKEHYDVQLMSGITLFNGRIAEAKTGEGKTITIYLPAFLASLEGKGVHVVTVNDYLANRDATEAARVFDLLGVSVGCVLNKSTIPERQIAYGCDITYVTNSQLGFDYLKDHLVFESRETVLRGLHYAIIDEVDSVLIDDAKTPLIISGAGPDAEDVLVGANAFVRSLKEGKLTEVTTTQRLIGEESVETGDYIKNEKEKRIYLTDLGIQKFEKAFANNGYGSSQQMMLQRAVNNALRANYMMFVDHDYIVKDDKVEIVDTSTGRVLPGRRFSDGLHQAIEAKEGVPIQKENITVATVTFQSFFNKYPKKAGLTGTAKTSAKEFKDVYNLEIVEIPTNKPVIRRDLDDCVFRTKEEKWNAVVEATRESYEIGQPVLIGTSNIEDSELVSRLLTQNNIPHNTLNAKNEELEAGIIANAGQFRAVTVATNMAGRGTDIILDDEAKKMGGLRVIGTERHDSRRIDNQLKGRSGRQGDPGVSQFFISLEDRIMRVFGEQSSLDMLMMMAVEPGQPMQYKQLNKIITKAQEAVETENRLVREYMMKYDATNNEHREQIYAQREEILNYPDPAELLAEMFYEISDSIIDTYIEDGAAPETWDLKSITNDFFDKVAYVSLQIDTTGMTKQDLKSAFRQMDDQLIKMKERQVGDIVIAKSVERGVMLRFIDRHWATFLSSMEYVKQNIATEAYAQRDPTLEYKKRGVELFNTMIETIQSDAVLNFMRCHVKVENIPASNRSDSE